jgi:hypothetical protein
MQPLFVFAADTHLEDGAWSTRPGIFGDSYYSFGQIVNYCIGHRLPLILGGDVLEKKNNSARPIAKLCAELSAMEEEDVAVYYIQGNHEYDRNAPWLSVHGWPTHLNGHQYVFKGVNVYGLDWLPRGEIQQAMQAVPEDTDILITHQVWDEFMKGLGRIECVLGDAHHVRVILNGDFHPTKEVAGTGAQGQQIRMLSPGSTCMQDCSESPDKYFFVIGREDNGDIVFEPHKLETRNFLDYQVRDQDTLDALCAGGLTATIAALPKKQPPIDKPIVRVKFDKHLPDAFLRLTTAAGDACHFFCEALPERRGEAAKSQGRSGMRNDLLAALAELLGEDTQEYKLAAKLVSAEEPGPELEAFFKAFFTEETAHAVAEAGSPELGASPVPSV